MKFRLAVYALVALALLLCLQARLRAGDEPAELATARARYERDVEQATRPLKERYIQALEQIKRSLTFKGDLAGALAVQQEMEMLSSATNSPRLVGEWLCRFLNGAIHHYKFEADGVMYWTDPTPRKKLKTTIRGKDLIVEFPDDDIIERITTNGNELQIEHFSPKSSYPEGPPATRGVAKRGSR